MNYLDFNIDIGKLSIDARVDYFDDTHHIQKSSMHLHEHVLCEVYFIESGNMMLQCHGNMLSLKTGDILVIPPHTPHRIISYNEELVRFNVQFMCKSVCAPRPYSFLCPDDTVKDEIFTYISLIRRYMRSLENKADIFRMNNAFSIVLSYVVEQLLPSVDFTIEMKNSNRLQQCIEIDRFFFEHYTEPITVSDLAKSLNYSETQTRRILREYTGMSFADKLRMHRIQAAKQYLTCSNFSIDEIAERCGYQSRIGFESMFKKTVGLSPSKYKSDISQK